MPIHRARQASSLILLSLLAVSGKALADDATPTLEVAEPVHEATPPVPPEAPVIEVEAVIEVPPAASQALGDPRRSITASLGLIQPLVLGGANVEVDFRYRRLVVSYSHGWSLEIPVSGAMKEQHLVQHVPVTTGIGIGVQHYFSAANLMLDVRAELKYHRFEFSLENEAGSAQRDLISYSTVTLGGGAYATWLPFARLRHARGLALALSFRVWPRVASTLSGNRHEYMNETTGQEETHHTANIGIANSPFIVNMSLGYMFTL